MNPDPTFKPGLIRPVWSDPGYMLALSAGRVTDYTPAGAGTYRVAPADPNRWAIGFVRWNNNFDTLSVGPWGDPENAGVLIPANGILEWFKLFDYGPIVTYEWHLNTTGPGIVRIVEIYNP